MSTRILCPALAAVLACAVLPAALSAAGHACMRAPFPHTHDGAHLIATATPDTVLAGAGALRYELEPGDPGGPIHGQVVRVERVGGPQAAELPAGVDRVVLVPWTYGAGCGRERWRQSARWAPPGERGLFMAVLRPREHWVNGLPTFDAGTPYPLFYPTAADGGEPPLPLEQAFAVLDLWPGTRAYRADRPAALRPLWAWARAHPALAGRYPAALVLRELGVNVEAREP